MELDARKQKVLKAIIDDYIESAEPVGSRTLARKHDLGVSPVSRRKIPWLDFETCMVGLSGVHRRKVRKCILATLRCHKGLFDAS